MNEIMKAAANGEFKILKELLLEKQNSHGAINQTDLTTGKTALLFAVENNQIVVVRWLLNQRHIDANIRDLEYNSALDLAVKSENINIDMIELLLNSGVKTVRIVQKDVYQTPLELVLEKKRKLEKLLSISLPEGKVSNASLHAFSNVNQILKCIQEMDKILKLLRAAIINEVQRALLNNVIVVSGKPLLEFTSTGSLRIADVSVLKNKAVTIDTRKLKKVNMTTGEVFSFHEPMESCINIKKSYFVPPLIFYAGHNDFSTYDLILRNLLFLKKLGYERLCFEFDETLNLDQTLSVFQESIKCFEKSKDEDNKIIAVLTEKFLREFKNRNLMSYTNIDLIKNEYRDFSLIQFLRSQKSLWDAINKLREQHFAKKLSSLSYDCRGGTITIVGFGHHDLANRLFEHNKTNSGSFLHFVCYNENIGDKTDSTLDNFDLFYESYVAQKNSFSGELIRLDVTQDVAIADKIFKESILTKMKQSFRVKHSRILKLTEETTAVKELKEKFQLPFQGVVDDEYNVDAILTVDSLESFSKKLVYIEKALVLKRSAKLQINDANQIELVIPNINSVNKYAISEMAKRRGNFHL